MLGILNNFPAAAAPHMELWRPLFGLVLSRVAWVGVVIIKSKANSVKFLRNFQLELSLAKPFVPVVQLKNFRLTIFLCHIIGLALRVEN